MTEDPRDRTRPGELVALAGGVAVFVGLVVLLTTRDFDSEQGPVLTIIVTVLTFVIFLVGFAMLALLDGRSKTGRPRSDADDSRPDDGRAPH